MHESSHLSTLFSRLNTVRLNQPNWMDGKQNVFILLTIGDIEHLFHKHISNVGVYFCDMTVHLLSQVLF